MNTSRVTPATSRAATASERSVAHTGGAGRRQPRAVRRGWLLAALVAAAVSPVRAQDTETGSETVRRAIHVCNACHGDFGRSTKAVNPSLAGQVSEYLQKQMKDYRSQARSEASIAAYMWGVSALLDDATIKGLAEYYAAQTPKPGKPADPRLVKAGRKIFEEGFPDRKVKACASCHGDKAEGKEKDARPRLAGQYAQYVAAQLRLFRGTPLRAHGGLMKEETKPLSDAEIQAVAAYVQSL